MANEVTNGKAGSLKTVTWTNATTTNVTPDTDFEIDLRNSDYCTIQLDSTATASTSSSIDCNVWASNDGVVWDTLARWDGYDTLADNKIHSFAITLGAAFVRLRLDNNTGSSRADVTARVWIGLKK